MTLVERNNKLKHFITCLKCEVSGKDCDDNCPTQYDAGNMGEIIENLEAISKALEPCEDAVSRKAVFETIDDCNSDGLKGIFCSYDDGERFKEYIKNLPPVTPTRKVGKWEYIGDNCFKCSKCGEVYTVDQFNHINNYCDNRFPKGCPNCGAYMIGEVEK